MVPETNEWMECLFLTGSDCKMNWFNIPEHNLLSVIRNICIFYRWQFKLKLFIAQKLIKSYYLFVNIIQNSKNDEVQLPDMSKLSENYYVYDWISRVKKNMKKRPKKFKN